MRGPLLGRALGFLATVWLVLRLHAALPDRSYFLVEEKHGRILSPPSLRASSNLSMPFPDAL